MWDMGAGVEQVGKERGPRKAVGLVKRCLCL